jgi:hypothetical protein
MPEEVSFEQFRQEWLSDVQAGDPSTTQLGNRFSHKILTQWLDVDNDTEDPVYCDGAGDGGIDIAYLHRKEAADGGGADGDTQAMGDTWYLVQSKYGSAFKGTTTLIEESQKVIDSLDGKRPKLSSLAAAVLERLTTFRQQASERDKIVLVFAAEDPLTEDQKRALDDVKAMGRARLGPLFDVESVSLDVIFKRTLEEAAGGAEEGKVHVALAADLVASGPNLLVGSTSLIDLYEFLKRYKKTTLDLDQLYEKNVRRFLGGRGKVNKAMQQTLRDRPEQFGLFNNGITLTAVNFTKGAGGYDLVEPYVVNGCQTTRTIWEVCQQKLEAGGTGKNDTMEEWKAKLKQGVVVTKIVKVGSQGEEMLQDITRYTNSQNAVKEKDFLTLTSDFRTWAKQMETKYDVFLEVQRGGWESRRALQKQRPDVKQFAKAANAFDLLKVYGAAWLGEAGTAYGRNAAFLPNGSIFKRIMNGDGDKPFAVEDLYAAYRLQQATETFKFGRTAEKNSRRQTKFLFPMVVTELLKDVITKLGQPATTASITAALSKLFEPENQDALNTLLDTSIQALDDYMDPGEEDSIYNEPAYKNDFNNDLNGMLKWEGLGKSETTTPRFRALISKFRTVMGMGAAGKKPRDLITAAIK